MAPYFHLIALVLTLIFLNKESLSARPYSLTVVQGQDCLIINTVPNYTGKFNTFYIKYLNQ